MPAHRPPFIILISCNRLLFYMQLHEFLQASPLSPQMADSLCFIHSFMEWGKGAKEDKSEDLPRAGPEAGARGGKGGCPELWEARVNKTEAASCREIWKESM